MGKIVTKALTKVLEFLIEGFIEVFSDLFVNLMSSANEVLDYPAVRNAMLFVQGLAVTLLVINILRELLFNQILYESGQGSDSGKILVRIGRSVAVVLSVPWLVKWMYQFGTTLAEDVAKIEGLGDFSASNWTWAIQSLGVWTCFTVLISFVMLAFVYIQTIKRSAELGVLAITGSIMAVSLSSQDSSLFKIWFKELIVISVSQAFQILLIKTAFYIFFQGAGQGNVLEGNIIAFDKTLELIAWLWVTIKTPGWLKQYAYHSGLGGAVGGGAKQAGAMVVARKVLTKGAV